MEIQERLAVSFAGAGFVQIPHVLVHVGKNGDKFLKLQASHPAICKLLCGKETELLKEPFFCCLQEAGYFERESASFLEKSTWM